MTPFTDSLSSVRWALLGPTIQVFKNLQTNQASEQMENWFTAILQVFVGLALCQLIFLRFSQKIFLRQNSSLQVQNQTIYCDFHLLNSGASGYKCNLLSAYSDINRSAIMGMTLFIIYQIINQNYMYISKPIMSFNTIDIYNYQMERNKSTRQSNTQLLKEVLIQFDIETQVNKIVFRCFGDLLKNHQQTFQYMKQSEKKLIDFQARLFKSEGFASSIEANVASKVQIANNLNRRLQTFSLEFYSNLKDNEALIQTMRRDYDGLVSSSQRNTYQIRSITDDLKRNFGQINRIQTKLQQQMTKITYQHEIQTKKLQQQLAQARREDDRFMKLLTEARAELLTKGTTFEQVSNDMTLYKYEKQTITNQLVNLTHELQTKLSRIQYQQMRLLFDSQMVTTRQHNEKIFKQLQLKNKNQDLVLKQSLQEINQISKAKWAKQQATNSLFQQNADKFKTQITNKIIQIYKEIDDVNHNLQTELKTLLNKQNSQNLLLVDKTKQHSADIEKLSNYCLDFQKLFQQHDGQFREFSASLSDLSNQITQIYKQSNQQKQNLQKLSAILKQQTAIKPENKLVEQSVEQIQNNRQDVLQLIEDLQKMGSRQQKIEKKIDQFNKKQEENIQNRVTELHRRISQVSIQIMNNIQRSENQNKTYTDTIKSSLETKLQFINEVSQEIKTLKQAFEGQMAEMQQLNKVLSQKMERTTSILTKFKSDISIKVQSISNQQQRRTLQIKQSIKSIEQIRKYLSNITQIITITLSIIISKEYTEEGDNKETVKISSLIQGWVLELDDKNQKYRGQIIHRRKLAMFGLNFLIFQTDKSKGSLIDSGKDIFNRMKEESQEIFTVRKRGLSRKIGSQLPKLHL